MMVKSLGPMFGTQMPTSLTETLIQKNFENPALHNLLINGISFLYPGDGCVDQKLA